MNTAVITGANRGIGLEFCRQLKEKGWKIHGLCRKSSHKLRELDIDIIENIDMGSKASIVSVHLLHPGYVKTEMTGGAGDILPKEAVQGMLKKIDELNISETGTFWHSNGERLPW